MAGRDQHPKKEVEEGLKFVEAAGWTVTVNTGRGHKWGDVKCPAGCCMRSVWSTPKNSGNHGKQLARLPEKCPKYEEGTKKQEEEED